MPVDPEPLPPDLRQAHAFRTREATAAGVPAERLRRADVRSVTHGVRTCQDICGEEVLAALALGLSPPFAFSHQTAAAVWRLPLPGATGDEPVHVTRPSALAQTRRRGVVGHRGLESRTTTTLRGLPVTDLMDTWADLASCGLRTDDLVVVADVVVRRRPDLLVGLHQVAARRRRGGRALREAAALVRVGSDSPMETRTRLALVRSGLPEPELNGDIHDDTGGWVARCDLVWREARVVVEHEGDQHRTDRRRWRHDIARLRQLEALGWRVVRVTADDLHGRRLQELVALLAQLLLTPAR
ncbi:DUF559 domain-containing protein [Janibacter alkaliphilus]|uniref:DUF559 domain-containing protein n=1 Tax=Janibacter alkaliphilus TaxID=1069963 RepID=A0A852X6K2_9MICO|nr:DUF559 domain-containing protein [Janibacter alkaliphilus]NYG35864.1 hypothetical protein [Janibacter alkaliphilus]